MFCVWSLFCYAVLGVLSNFAMICIGNRDGCFDLIVFLLSCDWLFYVALPHDVVGCYALCDYTFLQFMVYHNKIYDKYTEGKK